MKDLELKNIVKYENKEYLISTIATPIRHTWFEDDNRIVYETMVFPIVNDDVDYEKPIFNERYHTSDEAIAEHSCIIENIKIFVTK